MTTEIDQLKHDIIALEMKIEKAMDVISNWASYDGAHHKQWCIDQIARRLLDPREYKEWVRVGDETWDIGIAP